MRGPAAIAVSLTVLAAAAAPAAAATPAGCDASRPAVVYRAGAATAKVAGGGARLIPCRSDPGARALEPSIGFAADGRALFQGWELQPGSAGGVPPEPVVRRREPDGSWRDVSPGLGGPLTSLDPYLHVDRRTGRLFSVNFLASGVSGCSTVSISDDSGDSWRSSPLACSGFDGQSLTTGPPVSSVPLGYPNLVYYCTGTTPGSSEPASTPICSKSLDGGTTYVPTGALPWPLIDPEAQDDVFGPWAGNPAVGPDGTLYIPKRFRGQPEIAVSADEGQSWERVKVAANGASGETPRIALDDDGAVYYAWADAEHQAQLAVSRDRGRTWSRPLALAPPGVEEAALPWPAVTRSGRRVMVAYLATTRSPGAPWYDYCNSLLTPCEEGSYADTAWNGYMTMVDRLGSARPRLRTATVNPPDEPLFIGGCSADGACKANLDFINAQFGNDGVAAAAFSDDCQLERDFTPAFGQDLGRCADHLGEGVFAQLVEQPAAAPEKPRCSSRRVFRVHVRRALLPRARSVTVVVAGRVVARRSDPRRGIRVDLRGRGRGAVVVVLRVRLRGGRLVRDRRVYHPCVSRSRA